MSDYRERGVAQPEAGLWCEKRQWPRENAKPADQRNPSGRCTAGNVSLAMADTLGGAAF
jgi:hypothetical protein